MNLRSRLSKKYEMNCMVVKEELLIDILLMKF